MLKPATLLAGLLLMVPAFGQATQDRAADYPKRPVRIIVCVPAGGGVDTVTRIVADKLARSSASRWWWRTAPASPATSAPSTSSRPSRWLHLLASQPALLTVNVAALQEDQLRADRLHPGRDHDRDPDTLTVRPDFPAKTIQEFIAYAKDHPEQLNYASQGTGTTSHLTAELFSTKTGIKMLHVPYRGTAPAINDLISSHVDLMFTEMASAIEMHKGGRARILAVSAHDRSPAPAGHPDLPSSSACRISSPTPGTRSRRRRRRRRAIVAKLNAAIVEVLKMPDVQERLTKINTSPQQTTLEQAATVVKDDTQRWADVIKAADLKPAE